VQFRIVAFWHQAARAAFSRDRSRRVPWLPWCRQPHCARAARFGL